MTMPQSPFGTLHDLVSLYAKKGQAIPQLIVMHYAVEAVSYTHLTLPTIYSV